MRKDPTPDGEFYSVSTILEETNDARAKRNIVNWRAAEEAAGRNTLELSRIRGSAVHSARETWFKTGEIQRLDDSDPLAVFVNCLEPLFKGWDKEKHIWCEGPLEAEKYPECFTGDKKGDLPPGRMWSGTLGYAGCPDDVGYYNGILTLADLKTSRRPYYRIQPECPAKCIWWKAKQGDKEAIKYTSIYREMNGGYLSYAKCRLQLAAYFLLVKERLGIECENWVVLAISPGRPQKFTLSEQEKAEALSEWDKRLKRFHWDLAKKKQKN